MSWTDERIEELRKLWADGLSASQIADSLGGVSRNAVIGKIHRLGLSGRVKSARSAPRRNANAPRPAPRPQSPPRVMAVGSTVVKIVEREDAELAPEPEVYVEPPLAEVVPIHGGVTLFELKSCSCRWPIGDPSSPDFRFCGARTNGNETYCSVHAELAFPSRAKKKQAAADS